MKQTMTPTERLSDFGENPFAVNQNAPAQIVEGKRPRDLKARVMSDCDNEPGVYGFVDEHGVLFYVGKSRRLRARLLSYFSPKLRRRKPGLLIRQTRSILWETATSEFAALLRELQLIQRWRPRFNVKDQPHKGSSTYLCLGRPTAPGVLVTSKPDDHATHAFGPFWAGPKLDRAADALNRWFGLRDCANSQPMAFSGRRESLAEDIRPGCLRFELGTCLGPCVAAVSKRSYFQNVKAAQTFLEGDKSEAFQQLALRMNEAAREKEFELAARHRDDLKVLTFLHNRLARIRRVQQSYHFVYSVGEPPEETLWYLIRAGRVAGVVKVPNCRETATAVKKQFKEVYRTVTPAGDLTESRPDTLLLVASWFHRNPEELKRTLSLDEAKSRLKQTS